MLASLININKFYNGNQVLKNVNLIIEDNDRIGLIGANGWKNHITSYPYRERIA